MENLCWGGISSKSKGGRSGAEAPDVVGHRDGAAPESLETRSGAGEAYRQQLPVEARIARGQLAAIMAFSPLVKTK